LDKYKESKRERRVKKVKAALGDVLDKKLDFLIKQRLKERKRNMMRFNRGKGKKNFNQRRNEKFQQNVIKGVEEGLLDWIEKLHGTELVDLMEPAVSPIKRKQKKTTKKSKKKGKNVTIEEPEEDNDNKKSKEELLQEKLMFENAEKFKKQFGTDRGAVDYIRFMEIMEEEKRHLRL
jgi:hypothetical protein